MLEKLQERLRELQKQQAAAQMRLQQANADVFAINGAMQEVGYWINKESPKEEGTAEEEKK